MLLPDRHMKQSRNQNGSLATLLPAAILVAVVGIGAFALDISHNVTVRSEMQNATDAGALAGAEEMLDPATERNADNAALQVAEANTADGHPVSNSVNNTTVTTEPSTWDSATNSATMDVEAQTRVNNMFAKLFGHASDPVNAHSKAQVWRSVTKISANQGFPLAVSLDTANANPKPLYKMKVGDAVNFDINSQKFKNAAWTSFSIKNTNANWLNDAIDMLMGFKNMQGGFIPSVAEGDDLNMTNGVASQKKLADGAYESRLIDPKSEWVIPVMKGEPPYNQSRKAVGFITVRFTGVDKNQSGGQVETFHAIITKGLVKGEGGIPNSGNKQQDDGMKDISAGTVKLVQ